MKKRILAFILSGCIIIQNSGVMVQAAEFPLYTQTESEEADASSGEGAGIGSKVGETEQETGSGSQNDSETSSGTESGEGEAEPSSGTGEDVTEPPSGTGEGVTEPPFGTGEDVTEPPFGTGEGETESPSESEDGTAPPSEEEGSTETPSETDEGADIEEPSEIEDSELSSDIDGEENGTEEAEGTNVTDVSENEPEEMLVDAISMQIGSIEDNEDRNANIQYVYVEAQSDTNVRAVNSQSISASNGLYFGYTEDDNVKHTGTLMEYISNAESVVIPHKLGSTYMVAIGDGVFKGMNNKDTSDTTKLPSQSASGKTLLSSGETQILKLLNDARIKQGKVPLIMDSTLREAARRKTLDMINKNYFDHKCPDGKYTHDWLTECGYKLNAWGENIAYNYQSAERLYTQWWNSAGHKANMMSDGYRSIGIGVYKASDGKIMGTQIFSNTVFQNITSVTVEFGYEKIGSSAFYGCSNLASITIPSTVTEIAEDAFNGCGSNLTICGKEGSYAQTYADSHGITFKAVTEKSPIKSFGFSDKEITLTIDTDENGNVAGDWDCVTVSIEPVDYEHLIKLEKEETPAAEGETVIYYDEDDGTIHALSKGTVVITARAGDLEDTCVVTVTDLTSINIDTISFYDDELVLYEGESIKPTYRIEPINASDKVELSSSDNDIFVVDEGDASMITAVKAGTAVLTISGIGSDDTVSASASVRVRVLTKDKALEVPKNVKALTNISSTLEGVKLPEGFSWKEPQTKLKASNKETVQYFAAQYENTDENILQDCLIPVGVSTASGIVVNMGGSTLASSQKLSVSGSYELTVGVKAVGENVDASFLDVNYVVDKTDIIKVEKNTTESSQTLLLTPQKIGKCSITIEVKLKDDQGGYGPTKKPYGTYKKKYTLQVDDASYINGFQIVLYPESQDGVQILEDGSIWAEEDVTKFKIQAIAFDGKGASQKIAVKVKNDKSGVVKPATVKGQDGVLEISVNKPGDAKIVITAQDKGKWSEEIIVHVNQLSPQLNAKTWTLNKLKPTAAVAMDIQAAEDNPIKDIVLYEDKEAKTLSTLFSVGPDSETASYSVGFKDGKVSNVTKSSYKLYLKIITEQVIDPVKEPVEEPKDEPEEEPEDEPVEELLEAPVTQQREYIYPITIKLKNTKPSLKIKQSDKINLFYKDAEAELTINTGTENITDISQINVASSSPHFEAKMQKADDGTWSVRIYPVNVTVNNYKKIVKTVELRFSYQDYGSDFSITKKISIKNCYKKATLATVSSAEIYSKMGNNTAVFQIKDKTSGKVLSMGGEDNISVRLDNSMNGKATLTPPDNGSSDILIALLGQKSLTAKVVVSSDNWYETAACSVKLKVNTKIPSTALNVTKVSMNSNMAGKEVFEVKASVKNNDSMEVVRLREADIVGSNSASKNLLTENKITISTQKDGNKRSIKICLNSSNIKNGTYKYTIYGWCMLGEKNIRRMSPATLSITITSKEPSVSMKAKGKIDINNPENTAIVYTPKLSNIVGDIRTVKLSGGYSSQFILTQCDNGTYQVKLRENSQLKKGKYNIYFTAVLENGIKIESKAITVKL